MIRQHFACMMSCKHSSILIPNNFYYECYVYYLVNIALGFEFRCVVSAKFQEKILYFENEKKKKKTPLNFGTLKII